MVVKKILEIFKKYWISVVCGVVVLLALLAALVWPLPGYVTDLQGKLDERKSVYSNVEQLRKATRPMPVIDIENPAAAELTVFPSKAVIEAGEKATKEVTDEAAKMLAMAVEMNTHTLLLPDSLPAPRGPQRFQFRDVYLENMEQDPARRPGRALHFKDTILKAIHPPSLAEIELAKQKVAAKYEQLMGPVANAAQAASNKLAMDNEILALPERLRAKRSTEGNIYLSPDALSVNPNIRGNAAPAPEAIWSAQLMLWLQEDFCRAVAATNEDALSKLPPGVRRDVTTAPIKHLIKLNVSPEPRVAVGDPHLDPNTPLPEQPLISVTKRVSNALYEKYRFTATLNVETAKIAVILQNLSRNQFLTIEKVDATGLDSLTAVQQGYVYGTQPLATLNLECEVLYLRKWSEPLMPPLVKARLSQPGTAAPLLQGSPDNPFGGQGGPYMGEPMPPNFGGPP